MVHAFTVFIQFTTKAVGNSLGWITTFIKFNMTNFQFGVLSPYVIVL
ncbi:MAG: hypothetical protein VKL00_03700 [Synechococcales bacterium]|nr:hypothetical protein [Cyanobacteria bacterium REEB444]MEB3124732.1 hypothetical protein [Synechococcales bacterium]